MEDAGVVDQDVDAPEACGDVVDDCGPGGFAGDVVVAEGDPDLSGDALALLVANVGDDDLGRCVGRVDARNRSSRRAPWPPMSCRLDDLDGAKAVYAALIDDQSSMFWCGPMLALAAIRTVKGALRVERWGVVRGAG